MTATKRITRISAIVLLVVFLMSSMATFAMAAQKDGCTTTSAKSFDVTKRKGVAIKITATQRGLVLVNNELGGGYKDSHYFHGKYTISITYPDKTVKTLTWDAGRKTTMTLVGATKKAGSYKITISKPELGYLDTLVGGLSLAELKVSSGVWKWRTYPQFTIKY